MMLIYRRERSQFFTWSLGVASLYIDIENKQKENEKQKDKYRDADDYGVNIFAQAQCVTFHEKNNLELFRMVLL